MKNGVSWKDVYTTRNQGDIAIIKSLFDANKINYLIENEDFIKLPSTIKVEAAQFKQAKDLLIDFGSGDEPLSPI